MTHRDTNNHLTTKHPRAHTRRLVFRPAEANMTPAEKLWLAIGLAIGMSVATFMLILFGAK